MIDLKQVVETCTQEVKSPLDLADAQYTENFLDITDEIAKLQSISGEKPDYEAIIAKSEIVLSEEAKHIKPICYLIFTLYQLEKEKGLSAGLEILAISLEQLGDEIYPNKKKKRARVASFEWLRKQLLEQIEQADMAKVPQEHINSIAANAQKIKEWMLEYCEDQAISFFNTFKQYQQHVEDKKAELEAKEKIQKANEEAKKKEAEQKNTLKVEEPEETAEQNIDSIEIEGLFDLPDMDGFDTQDEIEVTSEPTESFASEQVYPLFLNQLQKTHLPFNIDALKPEIFDLHRALLWGQSILEFTEPAHRIEETTYPVSEYHSALKLYQTGEFETALSAFERLFFKAPFHFDIQYYQLQCIYKLVDAPHANKIVSTIKNRLMNLLRNHIELLEHQYPEGPKCASPHVSKWLINEVLSVNSVQSSQLLDDIIQNDTSGRSPTEQLAERYRSSPSLKEKLSLKLNLALNLKADGQDQLALNILEQTYKKLTSKALTFELIPNLASQICLQLWDCYNTIDEDKTDEQLSRQQQVFLTISKYCPEKFNHDSALDIDTEN